MSSDKFVDQPSQQEPKDYAVAFEIKATKTNQDSSLQDAFLKFMKRKKIEKSTSRQNLAIPSHTQAYKEELRKEFIERLKSYIGTPYSKLDCCGLIRRVLIDLQDKFGFKPLHYNQNYQMDTLPIRYNSHTEMKPGDLIFYEGLYEKPGKKQQKHHITHVEVYLGPDQQCIGSRYSKKCVALYDSYKFDATSWKLQRYHFCSIETWLDGTCKSFCPNCTWKGEIERLEKNKRICRKSIFEPNNCELEEKNDNINNFAEQLDDNDDISLDSEEANLDDDDTPIDSATTAK